MPHSPDEPVIHVIDDEAPLRRSLIFLLESAGWQAIGHASAEEFLRAAPRLPKGGGCLVLDVRMPGMNGLELQRELEAAASPWPIVFMSGHGDAEMAVRALQAGAVDFLFKPFDDASLLAAVERAIASSHHAAA
ncbi:MAG: response regulator [Rhodocyclaceae bacterium]|nr:response regulator [Rhodocyclaceae bacterium]